MLWNISPVSFSLSLVKLIRKKKNPKKDYSTSVNFKSMSP